MASNIVLARILSPAEFGILAIGTSIVVVSSALIDSGLSAALVRRDGEPTRTELSAATALQLVLALVIALVAWSVALANGGEAAYVTAVMVMALPAAAFKVPPTVIAERRLDFRPMARSEVTGALSGAVISVALVAWGAGVWGVVAGTLAASVLVTLIMVLMVPGGSVIPRLSIGPIRALVGFGFRFQVIGMVSLVRDQGLNLGLAAFGGTAVLGLWSLSWKLLQLPFVLLQSLWRVGFPALSRRLSNDETDARAVAALARMSAIAAALLIAPFAAACPRGVELVFGGQWGGVGVVVAVMSAVFCVSGPVSVSAGSYLSASGRLGALIRNEGLNLLVWLGVALPLTPSLGVLAVAVGFVPASLFEALRLGLVVERLSGAPVLKSVLPIGTVACSAIAIGVMAGYSNDSAVTSTISSAVAASFICFPVILLGYRDDVLRIRQAVFR